VLAQKIALYREARARHGHDPEAGQVAVMLHTFLGEDERRVKEAVRAPLTHYFRSNLKQLETHADLRAKAAASGGRLELDNFSEKDLNDIGAYAFERYYDTSLLCGTPDKCSRLVDALGEVGVNEIACLVDFGLSFETVIEGLPHLNVLRERYAPESCAAAPSEVAAAAVATR
jgi:alkanesulfonate monooxygenase SsuD/methylene tetrahydromethanopterin reductase-like flavin-dependent oxidoreductase (luciferase family)